MDLPFFYLPELTPTHTRIVVDEATSRHMIQVLRMQSGELLCATDGRGGRYDAVIDEAHKKHASLVIHDYVYQPRAPHPAAIGVALLKNTSRFEWFLEKAVECGVQYIFPLKTARTEKSQFRVDRMQQIVISAMLQSKQVWLTQLDEPKTLTQVLESTKETPSRFVAHCMEDPSKRDLAFLLPTAPRPVLILIGPEGDFTEAEVTEAIASGCVPVSLGDNRLRTETAAVTAAVLCQHLVPKEL